MDDMIRRALGDETERAQARKRYNSQFRDPHLLSPRGAQIGEEDEPLVDVFTNEAVVVVVAELPGVDKESIEVDATENRVVISVNSPARQYFKELNLPARVDPKSSDASYKNGVLEVRLKRVAGERLLIK